MSDWRKALLGALGDKATPQNMQFLTAWQAHEGGHTHNSARWNWLNTTHGEGPAINSVGVKRFANFQAGIRYTAETLQNGRYGDILDALSSGNPFQSNVGAGLQVWVSGRPDGNAKYAASILGHASPAATPTRVAPLSHKAPVAARAMKAQMKEISPNHQWDVAMRMIFDDDPDMAAIMAGMDDRMARKSGFVSPGGSLRPVPPAADAAPAASRVTKIAGTQLGKPYVFGSGPDTNSFDCSDLIQWAYKQLGIKLPRTTFDQIKQGRSVKGQALQPGDLVFPSAHHVVMYVGGGKVIAAPHTGTVVQYQPIARFGPLVDVRRVL